MELEIPLAAIRAGGGDPRRARILEGAFKVFLAYGFVRTTMDDIARAAELSRPALYLVFRNKPEIYRAIADSLLQTCLSQSKAVLGGEDSLIERLDRLVERLDAMMREIQESPHGAELLDMENSLAGDIVAGWREEMVCVLERVFAREAEEKRIELSGRGLSAHAVAQTFLDALEGMRLRVNDPSRLLATARSAARVVVAALRP